MLSLLSPLPAPKNSGAPAADGAVFAARSETGGPGAFAQALQHSNQALQGPRQAPAPTTAERHADTPPPNPARAADTAAEPTRPTTPGAPPQGPAPRAAQGSAADPHGRADDKTTTADAAGPSAQASSAGSTAEAPDPGAARGKSAQRRAGADARQPLAALRQRAPATAGDADAVSASPAVATDGADTAANPVDEDISLAAGLTPAPQALPAATDTAALAAAAAGSTLPATDAAPRRDGTSQDVLATAATPPLAGSRTTTRPQASQAPGFMPSPATRGGTPHSTPDLPGSAAARAAAATGNDTAAPIDAASTAAADAMSPTRLDPDGKAGPGIAAAPGGRTTATDGDGQAPAADPGTRRVNTAAAGAGEPGQANAAAASGVPGAAPAASTTGAAPTDAAAAADGSARRAPAATAGSAPAALRALAKGSGSDTAPATDAPTDRSGTRQTPRAVSSDAAPTRREAEAAAPNSSALPPVPRGNAADTDSGRSDAQRDGTLAAGPASTGSGLTAGAGARFAEQLQGLMPMAATAPAAGPLTAAVASPMAAALLPTPLHSPEFAPALGAQVTLFARGGVHQARIELNPAEMGPISVQIVMDGSGARVDFQADQAATRQVIEASLPALASSLRDAGMTLTGGGVSQPDQAQTLAQGGLQDGQAQGQGQSSGQATGQRGHGRPGPGGRTDDAGPIGPTTVLRPTAQRGLVDLVA